MSEHIEAMIEEGRRLVPEHMWGAVKRYMLNGIPPGSFLTAVLSNDLREAYARADDINSAAMRQWVQFLYSHAPRGSWGSPEKVNAWLAQFQEQAA